MCFGANPSDLGIAGPVLYTTIPHADVVEKISRCLHHHFRPMEDRDVNRPQPSVVTWRALVARLDLAKRPTGVGNRIEVLSVPAVRRERH